MKILERKWWIERSEEADFWLMNTGNVDLGRQLTMIMALSISQCVFLFPFAMQCAHTVENSKEVGGMIPAFCDLND